MKAALISDVGKIDVVEMEAPKPNNGELLIRVKACALCTHEQRVFNGVTHPNLPYLAGHEISGVVEGLGDNVVGKWEIGDRVVVRTLNSCMVCDNCRSGNNNMCLNADSAIDPRTAGLAQYICLPEFQVFRIPDYVPFSQGALTEPLACCVHSVSQCDINFGDDVVVVGAGIMGCFHTQLCKLKGARVIVVEPNAERREMAKSVGADVTIDPTNSDQAEEVRKLTDGLGADFVFNTVAFPESIPNAVQLLKAGGSLMLFSGVYPNTPVEFAFGQIHNKEFKVLGSFSSESVDFTRAVKLQKNKQIEIEKFIYKVFPLAEAQKAFESTRGAYRVVIDME